MIYATLKKKIEMFRDFGCGAHTISMFALVSILLSKKFSTTREKKIALPTE